MSDPRVLRHVIDSITAASEAHGAGAQHRVVSAGVPLLERLAHALGAAQHTAQPRAERRTIVVVAGDHGVGDPGVALGAAHPTVIAAQEIVAGTAALAQMARASRAPILVVDAGARERAAMPDAVIRLGGGPSRNLLLEPAMTVVDAALGIEAGIALAVSLVEDGLDVLVVGALGLGADVTSLALLGAIRGDAPTGFADDLAELAGSRGAELARAGGPGVGGIELLAAFGGPDTAVLAGLMLGAASMNVPVVLDGYATGAAALVAARLAPAIRGYLIAAHAGSFSHLQMLQQLGLSPIFEVGLGHGEGTGAVMILPLLDQVAALASHG